MFFDHKFETSCTGSNHVEQLDPLVDGEEPNDV